MITLKTDEEIELIARACEIVADVLERAGDRARAAQEGRVGLEQNADFEVARGRVVKPGRTLTVCRGDVFGIEGDRETHVATGLFSLICLEGLDD